MAATSRVQLCALVLFSFMVASCAPAAQPAPVRQAYTFPPTWTPLPSATPSATTTMVLAIPSSTVLIPTATPRPTIVKPIGPGKIAFASDRSGKGDIYVMDPDGTNIKQITSSPEAEAYPAWSPDGKALAFVAWTNEGGGSTELARIYAVNADGTGRRVLLPDASVLWPAWSPDGTRLAFAGAGKIDVARLNDNLIQPFLRAKDVSLRSPRWSPDGSLFTFASETLPAAAQSTPIEKNIYVANGDSTDVQLVAHGEMPSFSPDGKKIAFDADVGDDSQIFTVNTDGTGLTQLTDAAGRNFAPDWSPDGSHIVFASSRDGNWEIYVMDADGSNEKRLTNSPSMDWYPAWQR